MPVRSKTGAPMQRMVFSFSSSSTVAYGQDLATMKQGNWWGVINHENNEGVVRVGDNTETPGMKFWEWGQNNSFDTNPFKKGDSARPYIEL